MNLSKILNNLRQKNITKFILVGFFVFIFSGDITFAADEDLSKFAAGLDIATNFISAFLGIMTYLSAMFLSPEWINGSLFGLTEKFKDIWILVSNVVYFVFALIIIWIAFMNIIGNTSENYQLKQALPKFIVGILIVPFSWFLVQFVLSISAILTIASVNLPFDTFNDYKSTTEDVMIKTKCEMDFKKKDDGDFFNCTGEQPLSKILGDGKSSDKIYSVLSMYTYSIVRLDKVDELTKDQISELIKSTLDMVINLLFNILFILVYGILMIALGLVFMVRGFYIWIFIMLSPIFGLMYFFNKNDGAGEGFFKKINIKEFIALAMVPVYSMLALSFGMLFIKTVHTGLTGEAPNSPIKLENNKSEESTTFTLSEGISLTVKGAAGTKIAGGAGEMFKEGTEATLGIIGSLILKIFGIVVLWGSMMAAMRSSQITQAIVEPLHSFGTQVGTLMTKAPQYAPIFPGGQSMTSMSTAASSVSGQIDTNARTKGTKFAQRKFSKLYGEKGVAVQNARTNLDSSIQANDSLKINENIKKVMASADADTIAMDKKTLESLAKGVESLQGTTHGLDEKDTKALAAAIRGSKSGNDLAKAFMDSEGKIKGGEQFSFLGGVDRVTDINEAKKQFGSTRTDISNVNNNKLDFVINKDSEINRIESDGYTVKFDDKGKIADGSIEGFANLINGKTRDELKTVFNNNSLGDKYEDIMDDFIKKFKKKYEGGYNEDKISDGKDIRYNFNTKKD